MLMLITCLCLSMYHCISIDVIWSVNICLCLCLYLCAFCLYSVFVCEVVLPISCLFVTCKVSTFLDDYPIPLPIKDSYIVIYYSESAPVLYLEVHNSRDRPQHLAKPAGRATSPVCRCFVPPHTSSKNMLTLWHSHPTNHVWSMSLVRPGKKRDVGTDLIVKVAWFW